MKKKFSKIPNSIDYEEGGLFQSTELNSSLGAASGILSGFIPTQNKGGRANKAGSTASGAMQGIGAGAMFGPLGMGIGALAGGTMGFLEARKQRRQQKKEEAQFLTNQRENLNTQNMDMVNSIMATNNSSNLPMAMGGSLDYAEGGSLNPIGTFTEFSNGGTHEENPYGGIPQGKNQQGQMRLVEKGESKFKFKDGNYIFSNRLTF